MFSPLTSYTDQILSIIRTRTSAGFSLDIPLIMLTASILKIFYWPGARYDFTLLVQAIIMVAVQSILLKVALDKRPPRRDEGPFKGLGSGRPFNFWRWKSQRPYVSPCKKYIDAWRMSNVRSNALTVWYTNRWLIVQILGVPTRVDRCPPCLAYVLSPYQRLCLHADYRLYWPCCRSRPSYPPGLRQSARQIMQRLSSVSPGELADR